MRACARDSRNHAAEGRGMTTRPAFEAKHYAMRKSKDGTIVSFVVHPNDMTPELNCLPIGARVMIGWAQIGDDEKPIPVQDAEPAKAEQSAQIRRPEPAKPKRRFEELSLPQQCALRCDDGRFGRYLEDIWGPAFDESGHDVAATVRAILRVKSRSELSTSHEAANHWRRLETNFQQWLTDETYKDVAR
jgi:hypothetical protein